MQAVGQLPQNNTLYSIVKEVTRARTKGLGKLRLQVERMYVYNVWSCRWVEHIHVQRTRMRDQIMAAPPIM